MARALLAAGAPVDPRLRTDGERLDPRLLSTLNSCGQDQFKRLLRTGATPLHIAAAADAGGVVALLLDGGAEPDAADATTATPAPLRGGGPQRLGRGRARGARSRRRGGDAEGRHAAARVGAAGRGLRRAGAARPRGRCRGAGPRGRYAAASCRVGRRGGRGGPPARPRSRHLRGRARRRDTPACRGAEGRRPG